MKMAYETHGHKTDVDDLDISPSGDKVSWHSVVKRRRVHSGTNKIENRKIWKKFLSSKKKKKKQFWKFMCGKP